MSNVTDLEGTICLIDDILIFGKTQEEHDAWLIKDLDKLHSGLKIKRQQMRVLPVTGEVLRSSRQQPRDIARP